jgi:nitrate/nitrite-specific signal transduction histidine kinase
MEQGSLKQQRVQRARWLRPDDWPILTKILLGVVVIVFLASGVAMAVNAYTPLTGLLAVACAGLVGLALAYVLARAIVLPVVDLVQVTRQMGAGSLDVRAKVWRRDETGELAEAFNQMADNVVDTLNRLDERIAERTRALHAAAEVSSATTLALAPDDLAHEVVGLIRERFGLYYVGLFLLDEQEQFAVLRSGTGEAGRAMLAQGHRLPVSESSMIGRCIVLNQPVLAQDVGEGAVRFDNPLLPDTRSELALPVRSRGRLLGAMTVQSTAPAAFDEANIDALQTMADQIAVAIDNARLLAEARNAVRDLEATQRQYIERAWADYTQG